MKKLIFILFCCFSILIIPSLVFSNELTHAIGTTGYMIQEAMWAKAYKHDSQNYRQAVKLQSEAKDYMRGLHKKGRNTAQALELTRQAYDLAKQARDTALERSGKIVSY